MLFLPLYNFYAKPKNLCDFAVLVVSYLQKFVYLIFILLSCFRSIHFFYKNQ